MNKEKALEAVLIATVGILGVSIGRSIERIKAIDLDIDGVDYVDYLVEKDENTRRNRKALKAKVKTNMKNLITRKKKTEEEI